MNTASTELLAADPRTGWGSLNLDERTAAYDNNAAVENSAELIRIRDRRAEAYRRAHPGHLDEPYGPDERHRWDLYPADDATAPCLAFIHGGYWQRNGREQFAHLAQGVAAHGWSFAAMGYPLAPGRSLTDITRAVDKALTWLSTNGPKHSINGPIVLAGWSAGAHLASLALAHPMVTAGVAISGVYDLGPLSETSIGAPLGLTPIEANELSPLQTTPPRKTLVIAYADCELPALAVDAIRFHEHRRLHAAPGPLIVLPGTNHFSVLDALENPNSTLTRAVLDLAPQTPANL